MWIRSVQIAPISAVDWDWPPSCTVGPRVLNDSMWFWFRKVDAVATLAGYEKPFTLHTGDVLLIPAGVEHTIRQSSRSDAATIAVHFHAQVFSSVSMLDLLQFPALVPASIASMFLPEICGRLAHEFAAKSPGWTRMMEMLILDGLIRVLRESSTLFRGRTYSGSGREIPRLVPAFRLIEQRLGDPELQIKEIAAEVFLGEVRFRRVFRLVTGQSPVAFLRRLRVAKVCAELVATEDSIEIIGQRCGFSDSRMMRKVFHELVRTTPRDYRRNVRISGPEGVAS